MKFDIWEKQQLEKSINGSIKTAKANIKQIEESDHINRENQLKTANHRLRKYLRLLEKIKRIQIT